MRWLAGMVVVVLVAAGLVTACGGAGAPSGGLAGGAGAPSGGPAAGAAVFSHQCSYCHSLIGNESLHRQGGDLLGYTLTRQQLFEQTRQMPVRRPLTPAELTAVVDYVYAIQQRARGR